MDIIKKYLEDSSLTDMHRTSGVKGRLTAGPIYKRGHESVVELPHAATSELDRHLTNVIGEY